MTLVDKINVIKLLTNLVNEQDEKLNMIVERLEIIEQIIANHGNTGE